MSHIYKVSCLALFLLTACSNVDNSWCPPDEIKKETLSLSADALFKFDGYTLKELLPKDKITLDEFINKLKTNQFKITYLSLVGHTDRLGSANYNMNLGLKRAETIKSLLQREGVTIPIGVKSQGALEPVTTGCTGKGKALIDCLQPDRRVDITIIYNN